MILLCVSLPPLCPHDCHVEPQVFLKVDWRSGFFAILKNELCQIIISAVGKVTINTLTLFPYLLYNIYISRTLYDLSSLGNALEFQKIVWNLIVFPFFFFVLSYKGKCVLVVCFVFLFYFLQSMKKKI